MLLVFLCAVTLAFGTTRVVRGAPMEITDVTGFTAIGTSPDPNDLNDYGWGDVPNKRLHNTSLLPNTVEFSKSKVSNLNVPLDYFQAKDAGFGKSL